MYDVVKKSEKEKKTIGKKKKKKQKQGFRIIYINVEILHYFLI